MIDTNRTVRDWHEIGEKTVTCPLCGHDHVRIKRRGNPKNIYCADCISRYNRTNKLRRYGLSLESFAEMIVEQDGKCAICHEPTDNLFVDHCHATGVVRGLLCHGCNVGLGLFRERLTTLESAIRYLRERGDYVE